MGYPSPSGGERQSNLSGWGLCSGFMTRLPISGAVLSIVDRQGYRSTVSATDPVAARWDELELELGVGPLHEAIDDQAPQLIPDITRGAINAMIGSQFQQLGIRAAFAFPLVMGAATVGVAGLYRTTAGVLTADAVREALSIARAVSLPAVRSALTSAARDDATASFDSSAGIRREVHQATGMISAQLDVSSSEAFARLRAYSLSAERSITAVSRDVVDRTINFLDLE